jgi:DNA-binding NarL/FixJ family response regulator
MNASLVDNLKHPLIATASRSPRRIKVTTPSCLATPRRRIDENAADRKQVPQLCNPIPLLQGEQSMIDVYDIEQTIALQKATWLESRGESDAAARSAVVSEIDFGMTPARLSTANLKSLNVGLIDFHRFAEDCLLRALDDLHPRNAISSFPTVEDFIARATHDLDFVMYYLHGIKSSDTIITHTIAIICKALPTIPLIVFSDAESAQLPRLMHATMRSGARGFVPTRTAGLSITLAAIRLVNAGGTFVPADLMLPAPTDLIPAGRNRLTPRQMDVLSQLQLGKANKIIAFDLGMSESTVKVHIRNIMRKMEATNRTQAVYKARMHDCSTTAS